MRTYSRLRAFTTRSDEPPTKRRRLDSTRTDATPERDAAETEDAYLAAIDSTSIVSSSPLRKQPALFSDDAACTSTPPSSPPQLRLSPLPPKRKSVFALSKRSTLKSKPNARPLSERSDNVLKTPPGKELKKRRRLTQMQIDLGGDIRKACKTCGMEYIPSNNEDAALHRKFHAMNVGGVDIGKAFDDPLTTEKVWAGDSGSFVVVVDRKHTLAKRNKAKKVLELVNTELSAVGVEDEKLWSRVSVPCPQPSSGEGGSTSGSSTSRQDNTSKAARFKVFLYIQGRKCVGLCLAERISEAHRVEEPNEPNASAAVIGATAQSSSISASTGIDPAMVGISRIWTSNSHRQKGIAARLLDCAAGSFLYGAKIPKDEVAFSQPTESGAKLARRWFGKEFGWHVYVD
ncbi:hypothetical protein W97_06100 [Coniosporium apollinis CBS 100218]|uniref:N-acetyltransferase domain-containing protein n=1 Tax=Coniosporium apollinis (strain CBS 100218) TaxID=1168221 RepID=R7YYW3_CONA1|nr:uncharacterized protein W97_06100 [Coniosporium apollinis CBS 100218]EON66984.1 hypothetical protein W97_06100 [Coniosporium apollinis CBS 100218]